jgi:hypothetical protein
MVRIPAAAARSVMDDDLRSKKNWLLEPAGKSRQYSVLLEESSSAVR